MGACGPRGITLRSTLTALFVAMSCAPRLAAAETVPAETRQAIVDGAATELRNRYIYPDVGRRAAELLAANAQRGAYDDVDGPAAFAARLTADLRSVTHDKHLAVVAPGGAGPLPPRPPHSEAGIVRADRLSAGLGYIEVVSFPPLQVFRPVIDKAMQALEGSEALVIDVRRNTGGMPASVAYLVSFLTTPGASTPINDIVVRTPATTAFERETFTSQPTPMTFHGKPVFVLTSADTFSGGEEFAYDVQSLGLGRIVGETTGGGANPTQALRLASGYAAHIPFGRAENPVTKTNWEGRGVIPDIPSPATEALSTALQSLKAPSARDISQASRRQVFAPRTTPLPGSEAALRRLLAQVIAGAPDYETMNPNARTTTQARLARYQSTLRELGRLTGLTFVEVNAFGGDVYTAAFANGSATIAIGLTPDGKVDGWGIFDVARDPAGG